MQALYVVICNEKWLSDDIGVVQGCQPVSCLTELACSTGMDAGQAQALYRPWLMLC